MIEKRMDLTKTKHIVKKSADTTLHVTKHFIIWIFLLLSIGITLITLIGYISSGVDISTIASLGIGGFWAFFFGYFGWRLGQEVEEHFRWRNKK